MPSLDPDRPVLPGGADAAVAVLAAPDVEEVEELLAPAAARGQRRKRGFSVQTFSALNNPHFPPSLLRQHAPVRRDADADARARGACLQPDRVVRGPGVVSLANAIPGLLFSLVGGVVADRVPKKTVIQSAQIINMLNAAMWRRSPGRACCASNTCLRAR